MKKGLPEKPGWYWVKHDDIPESLGGEAWWDIKEVQSTGGVLTVQRFEPRQHGGYDLWAVPIDRLAEIEWYGPIPKPE